jgi:hypothetical protein
MKQGSWRRLAVVRRIFVCLILLGAGLCCLPAGVLAQDVRPWREAAAAQAQQDEGDRIEWFRKELGIAPQFREEEPGIFGMSWLHFLTMFFLAAFFVAVLVVSAVQIRRTRQVLDTMRDEGHGPGG